MKTSILIACFLFFAIVAESQTEGLGTIKVRKNPKQNVTSVQDVNDQNVSYPGGPAAYSAFLKKNSKYPQKALDEHVEGRVMLRLSINQEGKITDIQTIEGIGAGCEQEAIRVVRSMPPWNPARKAGKNIESSVDVPFDFKRPKEKE